MAAVVLRVVIMFGVLTLIYFGLVAYMRWDRVKTLEENHASGADGNLTREDFVAKGLAEYERSWERKALRGVFFLPLVIVLAIWLFASYS